MRLDEYEEAIRRAMLYGSSYVEARVVDPYKSPWWRRVWNRLRTALRRDTRTT